MTKMKLTGGQDPLAHARWNFPLMLVNSCEPAAATLMPTLSRAGIPGERNTPIKLGGVPGYVPGASSKFIACFVATVGVNCE